MPGRHGAPWTNGPPASLISRRFNVFNPAKIVDNLLLPILGVLSSPLPPRKPLSALPNVFPPSPLAAPLPLELCFYRTSLAHLPRPSICLRFVSKSFRNKGVNTLCASCNCLTLRIHIRNSRDVRFGTRKRGNVWTRAETNRMKSEVCPWLRNDRCFSSSCTGQGDSKLSQARRFTSRW